MGESKPSSVLSRIKLNPVYSWGLWSIWLTWPYWALGSNSFVPVLDVAMSLFPYHIVVARDWVQYGLTFWNSHLATGLDVSMLLGYYTPRILLFVFAPPWLAHGFLMWLNTFLAGYFAYRLCREHLGLGALSSIYAGMAYSITVGSFQFLGFILSLATIPFYLWAFEKCLARSGKSGIVLAGLLGLLVPFHSLFVYFVAPLWAWMLGWFVFGRGYRSRRFVVAYIVFVLMSLSVSILQIIPLWLNAPLAPRADTYLQFDLLNSFRVILSRLGFEFAVLTWMAWATRFRDRFVQGLLFLFVLTVGSDQILKLLLIPLKPLMGFATGVEVGHIVDWLYLLNVVIVAYGLKLIGERLANLNLKIEFEGFSHHVLPKVVRLTTSSLVLLFAVFAQILASATYVREFVERVPNESYAVNFANPDLKRLAAEDTALYRVASIGSDFIFSGPFARASRDSIYPSFASAYGFESVDGYFGLYYVRYQEFWKLVLAPIVAMDPAARQFASSQLGNHANLYVSPSLFHRTLADGQIFEFSKYYNLNLLSLANTKYIISLWPLSDPDLRLVNDPSSTIELRRTWGTRSTLERQIRFWLGEYPPRLLYIYENAKVLPRALVVPSVAVFDTSTQLLDALSDAPLEKTSQTAFILKADAVSIANRPLGFSRGSVNITEYTPDRVAISVESDGPGILVYSGNYTPYWQAFVDGQPAVLLPAYYTFQSVYVEAGQHQVVLEYMPPYKTMGLDVFRRVGLAK